MFKKLITFVKSLFSPVKIDNSKVDEYIESQRAKQYIAANDFVSASEGSQSKPEKEEKPKVKKQDPVAKNLNEKLKGVELPVYAQGKKLPPKAKRQYIKQAQSSQGRKFSQSPSGYGYSQVNHDAAMTAGALGGVATYAAVMAGDEPERSVDSCTTSYSSRSSSSYDSSYDSSSYDSSSSSSSSSCD